jgi:hypothetical protein
MPRTDQRSLARRFHIGSEQEQDIAERQSRDETGVMALERCSSVGIRVKQCDFDARLEQSMPCNQAPALG